jgi:UDP-3-O-[3-hydroxymyristoyl] N-acetylglucosamine deacetylase
MTTRRTLARPVEVAGIGLRTGELQRARLCPAEDGIVFVARGVEIPVRPENVVDATLATTLGTGGARVALVEHLLAALVAAGVDSVRVEVDGDELPILDGCALAWLGALSRAGAAALPGPPRAWTVRAPVRVERDEAWAELHPSDTLELDVRVDFPHPAIGAQRWSGTPDAVFGAELAWARTFGFHRDATRLMVLGIVRGATLDNTLVFDDAAPLNAGGLRARDEVVRHKALDALGDLALVPGRPRVRLVAHRGGHALHHALLHAAAASIVPA